jgi:hypothetical protein
MYIYIYICTHTHTHIYMCLKSRTPRRPPSGICRRRRRALPRVFRPMMRLVDSMATRARGRPGAEGNGGRRMSKRRAVRRETRERRTTGGEELSFGGGGCLWDSSSVGLLYFEAVVLLAELLDQRYGALEHAVLVRELGRIGEGAQFVVERAHPVSPFALDLLVVLSPRNPPRCPPLQI